MSTRDLQSAIKAMVAKRGVVETSSRIGVTTVSLQAFLHGSEVYAKTLAKMQKAAGLEITAIPAKEKQKVAAEERRAARKAKKAARLEKAKAKAVARAARKAGKTVAAKPKVKVKSKARAKSKTPTIKKSKSKKARARRTARTLVKKNNVKAAKMPKTEPVTAVNGVSGPLVAAEEPEETPGVQEAS